MFKTREHDLPLWETRTRLLCFWASQCIEFRDYSSLCFYSLIPPSFLEKMFSLFLILFIFVLFINKMSSFIGDFDCQRKRIDKRETDREIER